MQIYCYRNVKKLVLFYKKDGISLSYSQLLTLHKDNIDFAIYMLDDDSRQRAARGTTNMESIVYLTEHWSFLFSTYLKLLTDSFHLYFDFK